MTEMTKVESSWIKAIGHDEKKKVLVVEMLDGSAYEYDVVSARTFDDFLDAPSKGTFLNDTIKPNYL